MSANCCQHAPEPQDHARDARYRRVLWIALAINAGMFLLEIGAGFAAGSVSLSLSSLPLAGFDTFFLDGPVFIVRRGTRTLA